MSKVWAGVGGWAVFMAVFIWWMVLTFASVDQDDINRACEDHGGVVQYVDTSFTATDGAGTAICADKTAQKVED